MLRRLAAAVLFGAACAAAWFLIKQVLVLFRAVAGQAGAL